MVLIRSGIIRGLNRQPLRVSPMPTARHMNSDQMSMSSATTLLRNWLRPNARLATRSIRKGIIWFWLRSDSRIVGPSDIRAAPIMVMTIPTQARAGMTSCRNTIARMATNMVCVDVTGTTRETSCVRITQNIIAR